MATLAEKQEQIDCMEALRGFMHKGMGVSIESTRDGSTLVQTTTVDFDRKGVYHKLETKKLNRDFINRINYLLEI